MYIFGNIVIHCKIIHCQRHIMPVKQAQKYVLRNNFLGIYYVVWFGLVGFLFI